MLNPAVIFIVSLTLIAVSLLPLMRYQAVDVTSNLYIRVKAWCWMLAILSLVIGLSSLFSRSLLGQIIVPIFTVLLALLGSREILLACHIERIQRLVLLILVFNVQLVAFLLPIYFIYPALVALMLLFWQFYPMKNVYSAQAKRLSGLVFLSVTVSMLSLMILMQRMELPSFLSLFIYLLFAAQFNDISQYLCGKRFGKRLLAPIISPNKTTEGAIGGVIFSCCVSIPIGVTVTELSLFTISTLSLSLAITGIFGDLCVSWLKRLLSIKDLGSMISGHGGMMDRIDSLLFSLPISTLLLLFVFKAY